MIASSIQISPEVLASNKLTTKRKRQLRQEAIMKLIDSKPVGTPIKLAEFGEVARIERSGNVHIFIKAMERDKLIGKYETERRGSYAYSVLRGAKTIKPPRIARDEMPPVEVPKEVHEQMHLERWSDFDRLERLAKSFAWENNSDSLREFVTYARGRL